MAARPNNLIPPPDDPDGGPAAIGLYITRVRRASKTKLRTSYNNFTQPGFLAFDPVPEPPPTGYPSGRCVWSGGSCSLAGCGKTREFQQRLPFHWPPVDTRHKAGHDDLL